MQTPEEREIEDMVGNLTDWFSKQPHLPKIEDTDFLRKFLVNCKYRVPKTESKIDKYFTARTLLPGIFRSRDPCDEAIRKISILCPFFLLNGTTVNGERVFVSKVDPNATEIVPMDYVRRLTMVLDVSLLEQTSQLNYIIIVDYTGFSFSHFVKWVPIMKVVLDLLIEIYPGRLRSIHAINCPPFMSKIVTMFNAMVKGTLRERFFIHSEVQKCHAMIGREFLPSDLGGNEQVSAEQNYEYQKKIESYKGWFESQAEIRSNEHLRPGSKDFQYPFGSSLADLPEEGSFRRLNVD